MSAISKAARLVRSGDGARKANRAALLSFCLKHAHSTDPELRADALVQLDKLDPARARQIRDMHARMALPMSQPKQNISMQGSTLVLSVMTPAEQIR